MLKILILVLPTLLIGCKNPISELGLFFGSTVSESILNSRTDTKTTDRVKQQYLNSIKQGLKELKALNDPNIQDVYTMVEQSLKDNDLTVYEYNSITSEIANRKRSLNLKDSTHKKDVQEFKKTLYE